MTAGSGQLDAVAVLRALPSGWTFVHDGSAPGAADADHVVVGHGGIFLVSVRDRPGSAHSLSLDDDCLACSTAADVVAEMSGAYARRVRPVLCIAGHAELLEQALDVLVCSTATLSTALTSAPVVLADAQCDEVVALLGGASSDETAPLPAAAPAPRGKRARPVEPDSEPELSRAVVAARPEEGRGKRARLMEPTPAPDPELVPPVPPVAPLPPVPLVPPMSVPMIPVAPPQEPRPQPPTAPVSADSAEPDDALTGRARRVAEAMATRDAQAAKLAELQGRNGSGAAPRTKAKRKVGKLLKLLVAAAVVGVLALNGPHLVSTAGTWGPDLWARLNGRSGSASACAPSAAAPTASTGSHPVASKAASKRVAAKQAAAKAGRSRAGRKAAARAKRHHHQADSPRTPALETPVC